MRKKWLTVGTALMISAMMMAGCGNTENKDEAASTQKQQEKKKMQKAPRRKQTGGSFEGMISPVSREEGSGTRGAFIEFFGIETKDEAGNKIDNTTDMAEVTNSTSVMLTTVEGNEYAIGYISLGSMDETKSEKL